MIITGSSEGQIRNRHAACEISGGTVAAAGLWFHRTRRSPLLRAHYRKGGASAEKKRDRYASLERIPHPTVSSRGENARQAGGTEENEHNVFTLGAALARAHG